VKEGDVIVVGLSGGTSSTTRPQQNTSPLNQRPPAAGGQRGR
jgi:hypothetical protein